MRRGLNDLVWLAMGGKLSGLVFFLLMSMNEVLFAGVPGSIVGNGAMFSKQIEVFRCR